MSSEHSNGADRCGTGCVRHAGRDRYAPGRGALPAARRLAHWPWRDAVHRDRAQGASSPPAREERPAHDLRLEWRWSASTATISGSSPRPPSRRGRLLPMIGSCLCACAEPASPAAARERVRERPAPARSPRRVVPAGFTPHWFATRTRPRCCWGACPKPGQERADRTGVSTGASPRTSAPPPAPRWSANRASLVGPRASGSVRAPVNAEILWLVLGRSSPTA